MQRVDLGGRGGQVWEPGAQKASEQGPGLSVNRAPLAASHATGCRRKFSPSLDLPSNRSGHRVSLSTLELSQFGLPVLDRTGKVPPPQGTAPSPNTASPGGHSANARPAWPPRREGTEFRGRGPLLCRRPRSFSRAGVVCEHVAASLGLRGTGLNGRASLQNSAGPGVVQGQTSSHSGGIWSRARELLRSRPGSRCFRRSPWL